MVKIHPCLSFMKGETEQSVGGKVAEVDQAVLEEDERDKAEARTVASSVLGA